LQRKEIIIVPYIHNVKKQSYESATKSQSLIHANQCLFKNNFKLLDSLQTFVYPTFKV